MYTNCSSTSSGVTAPPPLSQLKTLQHPPTIVTFVDETDLDKPRLLLQWVQCSDADDLKRMPKLIVAEGREEREKRELKEILDNFDFPGSWEQFKDNKGSWISTCKTCQKELRGSRRIDQFVHSLDHMNKEMVFRCNYCPREFNWPKDRKRHVERVHLETREMPILTPEVGF